MASRRKRSKTPSYLLQIRKRGAYSGLLVEMLDDLSQEKFQNFLAWNYPRYRNSKIFCGLRPRHRSQLGLWIRFHKISESQIIRWVSSISELFEKDIANNNQYTVKMEQLGSDYDRAHKAALCHFNNSPISFCSLTSILYCISKVEGLEKKRKWMVDNLYIKSANLGNLLLYFKGIAAEGGRDPDDIFSIMSRTFFHQIDDNQLSLSIHNMVFGYPINSQGLTSVISVIAGFPAVDQYEAVVNYICSNAFRGDDNKSIEFSRFTYLMKATEDWRYLSLFHLDGCLDKECIFLPICDAPSKSMFGDLDFPVFPEMNDREFRTFLADKFLFASNTPSAYIASSHYIVKYSDSVEGFLQGLSRREVANVFYSGKSPERNRRKRVYLRFDALSQEIIHADSEIERSELFRLSCLLGIYEGRVGSVLSLLYEESNINPRIISYFPISSFFKDIDEDDIISSASDPKIPIAIARLKYLLEDEGDSILYLAVEEFLNVCGVLKPSDLSIDGEIIEDFLYEACILDCLRQSLEFSSRNEVEEERLMVLRRLESFSTDEKKKQYEEDIHNIVGQQTVNELLQRYEIGKIHCDERAIHSWARLALEAKFIRLMDFIESGMLPLEEDSEQEFISHVSSGKAGAFVFKVPNSEAFNIAKSIIDELLVKYALDPRHGIDSYLSLGMRHGTLVDHLRTPLSKHHLITSKGTAGYEPVEYWERIFAASGDPDIGKEVSDAIIAFSEEYDLMLRDIKDELVQVQRPQKPRGIINLDWQQGEVLAFMSAFTKMQTMDELLDKFSEFYWSVSDIKLKTAREAILGDIGDRLLSLLKRLERQVEEKTGFTRLGPFTDAVMRANDNLRNALQELASWHNLAKSTDNEPIGLQDIVYAAQKIVTRLHPEFQPSLTLDGDTNVTLTSSLNVLIEIFKALFTNVSEHSGDHQAKIHISVDASQEKSLLVLFRSSCIDLDKAEEAAKIASQRIASGEYETRLPTEGGSGLPKVARATVSDGGPNTRIWIDRDESMFCVEAKFSLYNF